MKKTILELSAVDAVAALRGMSVAPIVRTRSSTAQFRDPLQNKGLFDENFKAPAVVEKRLFPDNQTDVSH